ncbi:MAG: stage 0 sporulation protein, partial [Christensenellaceae bacterium]
MSDVIGVRFKKAGKVYYFAPGEEEFAVGDGVIVETVRGVEFGTVVVGRKTVDDRELTKPLRGVKKKADEHDYAVIEENRRLEKQAFDIC